MDLVQVIEQLPDFARDTRLNLSNVLAPEGAPGLSPTQIGSVALACAYALASGPLAEAAQGVAPMDDSRREAARAAATIMGMNNVYYRSMHLMGDAELKKLPARLRMNIFGNPGVDRVDFELMCFAVSALAGCGQCLTAHLQELRKASVSDEGIQSVLRIASVINAAFTALRIREL